MAKEMALIVNTADCVGCAACEVACKQEHNLPVGPKWITYMPILRRLLMVNRNSGTPLPIVYIADDPLAGMPVLWVPSPSAQTVLFL